jgi:hypothetical protein
LHSAIDVFLRIITLNRQRHYLTRYHTVLGHTLYVPPTWDSMSPEDRYILLRHERVHLRQLRRLGSVGITIVYLFPILPLGLALGRAMLEFEAYKETIRATAEIRGLSAASHPTLREHLVARFTSADYGWMWPFPKMVGRWFDEVVESLSEDRG